MEYNTCCFTGHRPSGLSFGYDETDAECIRIKGELLLEIQRMITNHNVTRFITGMALGVDTWAAEAVLELKKTYPDIELFAAVPCPEQTRLWNRAQRERYKNILSRCDEVKLISEKWTPYCMTKRNQYMVNKSRYLIAVWNGSFSCGTGKTVEYARKKEKNMVIISCLKKK